MRLKWCTALFFTMLPSLAAIWAIMVLFEKPLLSIGFNLLLVIPSVLVANTPLWILYPYCYSDYTISCFLHDFTLKNSHIGSRLFPFLSCAVLTFILMFIIAVTCFGKKEMK